jgi:hypothetical protein
MKKHYTLLLLLPAFFLRAQGYQRMLADSTGFQIVQLVMPLAKANQPQSSGCVNAEWGYCQARTDSIYKGKAYKRFYQPSGFSGLIREDTLLRKVYFMQYCDTTEQLLYDFSLTQGSTIQYNFPNSTGAIISGTYTVDSIKLKRDYNVYRRHFYLCNHAGPTSILEMVEGVGNVSHPLFLNYYFQYGELTGQSGAQYCPGAQFDEIVSCKWDNGVKVYYDSCTYALANANPCVTVSDSCHYNNHCSDIEEFSDLITISVYPNPASEQCMLHLEAKKRMPLSISLFNFLGGEVVKSVSYTIEKENNTIPLSVSGLPDGLYFIRISGEKASKGIPVIVKHQ